MATRRYVTSDEFDEMKLWVEIKKGKYTSDVVLNLNHAGINNPLLVLMVCDKTAKETAEHYARHYGLKSVVSYSDKYYAERNPESYKGYQYDRAHYLE